MASTAEGAIVAAALHGGEAEAAASGNPGCRLPGHLDLGSYFRVFMGGQKGEEMRMDQGLDSCFADNLRKRNNNNKTLQPLHSSACRGAFFSSCKTVGEGRENNDRSTYYTGSKTRGYIKRIQSCFLKVSCFVKLFSLF